MFEKENDTYIVIYYLKHLDTLSIVPQSHKCDCKLLLKKKNWSKLNVKTLVQEKKDRILAFLSNISWWKMLSFIPSSTHPSSLRT